MVELNQAGRKKYPFLFNPLQIRHLRLPNRIFWPAWDVNWANEDGSVSEKLHNFYINLAENGAGIIYTGAATVSSDSLRFKYSMAIYDKIHVAANKELCKELEARGAVPAIQLMNFGRQSVTTFTRKPILAPSNVPCRITSLCDPGYQIKEMTLEEIERVENDYIKAAVLAAEAGYKIVQVHAAHGYLISNFLSPYTNKRTDQYGGSTVNRCRFLTEVVEGIRKKLGNSIIIDVRLSVDELVEGGLVPEDYAEITPLVEKAGADMMNASGSIFESTIAMFMHKLEPEARFVFAAETLKKHTALPIGHAAFIGTLEKGDELLKECRLDLVGYGRMQFADPAFVKKSVMGEKINKCIWCGRCICDLLDPELDFIVHCSVNKAWKRPNNTMFNFRRFSRESFLVLRKIIKESMK